MIQTHVVCSGNVSGKMPRFGIEGNPFNIPLIVGALGLGITAQAISDYNNVMSALSSLCCSHEKSLSEEKRTGCLFENDWQKCRDALEKVTRTAFLKRQNAGFKKGRYMATIAIEDDRDEKKMNVKTNT